MILALLSLGGATLAVDDDGVRTLFNFKNVEAAKQWQSVSDGVMGGRSEGQFKAMSFGRVVQNQPLDSNEFNGVGILLGDKKAGPFKLEIEWIKVGIIKDDLSLSM